MTFKEELIQMGSGERDNPLCFAYHNRFGVYVPVIEFEKDVIIWDDGQITREYPPEDAFEIAEYGDFDLSKSIYFK